MTNIFYDKSLMNVAFLKWLKFVGRWRFTEKVIHKLFPFKSKLPILCDYSASISRLFQRQLIILTSDSLIKSPIYFQVVFYFWKNKLEGKRWVERMFVEGHFPIKHSTLLTPAEVGGHICKSLNFLDSSFVCELLHYYPVSIGNVSQPAV